MKELIQKEPTYDSIMCDSGKEQEAILWKQWFKSFHSIYHNCIQFNDNPFQRGKENTAAKLFYEFEAKRYRENPKFWFPVMHDCFIQNDYYSGKIDRVDQLNEKGDCRVIQYIEENNETIAQELLFSAVLLSHEKERLEWFPEQGQISEIAAYNIFTGEFQAEKISERDIIFYESKLYETIKAILRPTMKKKINCENSVSQCPFKEICKRMPL